MRDLSPLSGLAALESLSLRDTKVSDLSPLSRLTALKELQCQGSDVSDLSPLSGLIALEKLDLLSASAMSYFLLQARNRSHSVANFSSGTVKGPAVGPAVV